MSWISVLMLIPKISLIKIKGKHINFNQGEKIKKGEYLLDGQPLPHDILRILGIKELTEYFVNQNRFQFLLFSIWSVIYR